MAAWLLLALYFTVVQPDLRVRLVMASVGAGAVLPAERTRHLGRTTVASIRHAG